MPYVITTMRPVNTGTALFEVASRRAVAALEDARTEAHAIIMRLPTEVARMASATDFARLHNTIEAWDGIGPLALPLPDASVIGVEPTTYDWLMEQVPDVFDDESRHLAVNILDAYNALERSRGH